MSSSRVRMDYLSGAASFDSDSIPLRADYERRFLDHRAALSRTSRTFDSHNSAVFGPDGIRERLARNARVNPPRDARQMEIARDNAKLVERLTEISFKQASQTTAQIRERNKRVATRLAPGGSLNDHVRQMERERIEAENAGLAARLLANRSQYEAENFREHMRRHNYLLKAKSRLRAIQMKTGTPGSTLAKTAGGAHSARGGVQSQATRGPRNRDAEQQASDECAGALRSYEWQQNALGYGLTTLPPLPRTDDAALFGAPSDPWLEQHQSDLQRLKQEHTHAPRVRQSKTDNPREALHAPFSKHYHQRELARAEEEQARALAATFASLEPSELVVPRTKLDLRTGAYELEWVELKHARADEQHLAQRRPASNPESTERQRWQQQHATDEAMAAWQHQQQASVMYAAYAAWAQQQAQQQQTQSVGEAKESSDPAAASSSTPILPPLTQPPPASSTSDDNTPPVAPVWPFGGSILPPHLLPPPGGPLEPLLSARSTSRSPSKRRQALAATRARGRGGQQIFKLRKHPKDATSSHSAASSPRSKRSLVPHAPNEPSAAHSARTTATVHDVPPSASAVNAGPMRWQSHAQHVESVTRWAATEDMEQQHSAATDEDFAGSASSAAPVPTIASQLGGSQELSSSGLTQYSAPSKLEGARGVPLPAFPAEFEGSRFMASTASAAAQRRNNSDHPSPRPSRSSPRAVTQTAAKVSTPSQQSQSQLRHVPSSSLTHSDAASVEKGALVSEDASVHEKIDAFEQLAANEAQSAGVPSPIGSNSSQAALLASGTEHAAAQHDDDEQQLRGKPQQQQAIAAPSLPLPTMPLTARLAHDFPMSIAHTPSQAALHAQQAAPFTSAVEPRGDEPAAVRANSAKSGEMDFDLPEDVGLDL